MPGRRKNPRNALSLAELVVPHNFAGVVVQRTQRRIGPQVSVAAPPSFRLSLHRIVKNAEETPGIDIEQPRLRIKTWRHPIRRAVGTGLDQCPVRTWRGFGFRDWAASRINTRGP